MKDRRNARLKHYWIVTYDINGKPHRYFCWDYEQVWRWSKTPEKATRFYTKEFASSQMESCSMSWQYKYSVRSIEK